MQVGGDDLAVLGHIIHLIGKGGEVRCRLPAIEGDGCGGGQRQVRQGIAMSGSAADRHEPERFSKALHPVVVGPFVVPDHWQRPSHAGNFSRGCPVRMNWCKSSAVSQTTRSVCPVKALAV